MKAGDIEARFATKYKVDPATGCWLWGARLNSNGYAWFAVGRREVLAHRWAYQRWVGPIPDGMQLDHFVCDTRRCVNPQHLRPVTPRENSLRSNSFAAWHAAKTHCPKGHPYVDENTVYDSKGGRVCRQCRKDRWRARQRDPVSREHDNLMRRRRARTRMTLTENMKQALRIAANANGEITVARQPDYRFANECGARTAWALEKRGLIAHQWTGRGDGSAYYVLTAKGSAVIDALQAEAGEPAK